MFLQPKDSAERAREVDAFNSRECDHAFSKAGGGGITPFEGPLRFPLDAWHGLDRADEVLFLRRVFDVRVDEERIGFTVNILYGNLEAVEAPGFRRCDFCGEVAAEVLVDNAM